MARVSAIIVKKDKVLLIHRKKEGREYWVFPGGKIEEKETPEKAIIREVKEETSLNVTEANYSFDYVDEEKNINPVFLCQVKNGRLQLGGPEAQKNSDENWYHPEWIELKKATKLNVYPDEGKRVIKNLLNLLKH